LVTRKRGHNATDLFHFPLSKGRVAKEKKKNAPAEKTWAQAYWYKNDLFQHSLPFPTETNGV